MDSILVSISCITFNHADHIRECLEGFVNQETSFAFEILIYDDASTDQTADIVKEYELKFPKLIKPIYQKENQYSQGVRGMNIKFNYPRANGKYIALCEGDDYWTDPNKLQKQVDFLEANPDHVLVGHNRITVDGKNCEIHSEKLLAPDYYTQCILFLNVLKTDYLQFDNRNIANGDTFLILYLSNFGKKKILDFVGAAYRISDVGIWSKISPEQKLNSSNKSLDGMIAFFEKFNYPESKKIAEEYKLNNHVTYLLRVGKTDLSTLFKIAFTAIRKSKMSLVKTIFYHLAKGKLTIGSGKTA